MDRRLIIDGNAVYELDEKCMLRKKQAENHVQEDRNTAYASAVKEEKNRME